MKVGRVDLKKKGLKHLYFYINTGRKIKSWK